MENMETSINYPIIFFLMMKVNFYKLINLEEEKIRHKA